MRKMVTAKSQILASSTMNQSFKDASNFCATYAESMGLTSITKIPRKIGDVNSRGGGRGRGRGRSNGRGGRGGRFGQRGRGGGRGRDYRSNREDKSNDFIPYNVWNGLPESIRHTITEHRNGAKPNDNRSASAASSGDDDTNKAAASDDANKGKANTAGVQFGRSKKQ